MRNVFPNCENPDIVAKQYIEDAISVCEYIIERNPSSKSQLVHLRGKAADFVAERGVKPETVHHSCVRGMGWTGEGAVGKFEDALWEAINGNVNNLRQACFRVSENDQVGRRRFEDFFDTHFSNEILYYCEEDLPVTSENDGPGWVYIIVNPLFPGWVKIGCTKHYKKREENFQTYAPKNYRMVRKHHSIGHCYRDEQKVHKELEKRGIEKHREWFKMSIEDAWSTIKTTLHSLFDF